MSLLLLLLTGAGGGGSVSGSGGATFTLTATGTGEVGPTIGAPVWDASTADVGPTFTVSRTFPAGARVSAFVTCRDTSIAEPTVQFDGVDTFGLVVDYPAGSNIARAFEFEGVISAGGTANLVVEFPSALAAGNVIIGTSVIGAAVAGSGWRDAPVEDGHLTSGALALTIGSEPTDEAIAWAVQRGSASTLVADGNTTEVGAQASTGTGGTHLVAALWRRRGAAPSVAVGGTWNSSSGGALVGHNVNYAGAPQGIRRRPPSSTHLEDTIRLARQRRLRLADLATESPIRSGGTAGGVVGAGGATFTLSATGTATVAGPPVTGSGGATFTLTATGTGTTSAGAVSGSGGATFTLTATGTGTFVPPAVSGAGGATFTLTATGTGTTTAGAVSGSGGATFTLTATGAGTVVPPTITGSGGATFTLTATGNGTTTVGAITGAGGATFTLRATGTGAVVAFGAGQLHLTAKVRIRPRFSGPPILDMESST